MSKLKLAAFVVAVVLVAPGLMPSATASHTVGHEDFSGGSGFKGLVVKTKLGSQSIASVSPSWTTVESRGFQIPAGESQLIVVDFFSGINCMGSAPSGGGVIPWCAARVRVGTSSFFHELRPSAGVNFSLAHGQDDSSTVAMSRALCVRNPSGSAVDRTVDLQVTKSSDRVISYNLNNWTLKISRNAQCSPFVDI